MHLHEHPLTTAGKLDSRELAADELRREPRDAAAARAAHGAQVVSISPVETLADRAAGKRRSVTEPGGESAATSPPSAA